MIPRLGAVDMQVHKAYSTAERQAAEVLGGRALPLLWTGGQLGLMHCTEGGKNQAPGGPSATLTVTRPGLCTHALADLRAQTMGSVAVGAIDRTTNLSFAVFHSGSALNGTEELPESSAA
jgi:hypothetical protein